MHLDWTWTPQALEALQRDLAERWRHEPRWRPPAGRPVRAGGVFVATPRGEHGPGAAGDPGWAAAVILQAGRHLDSAIVSGHLDAPYVPGLLALREGRLLAEACARLREPPDVLLVNATGRDHPRRAGLALQLGAALGVPTIGVTDRPLIGDGPQPGPDRGARAEVRLQEEVVGCRLRTRANARPVIVHSAWRTEASAACAVVLALADASRTPAPLREARRLARTARRGFGMAEVGITLTG